ncbi:hypothetical protein VTK73DRAFT_10058 [Phialemonium thermophilum]|uniref:Rhodopsin domain-containing protein n=1 Tax=Phialemonium thermophilum TaxID=223376 RepID=A0ABR3VZ28_9PEZI
MPLRLLQRAYSVLPTPDELDQIDLDNHSSLVASVYAVNIVFLVLASAIVALRLYTRACLTKQFFIDDALAILAVASILICTCVALVATRYGLGRHVWDLPMPLSHILHDTKRCVQLMFVANVFYATATAFTKMSIITSCLRIFPSETLRRILYVTAAVVVGLGVSAVFATIFQCSPVRAAWDFELASRSSHCYPFVDFLYANSAINIATDFIICLAPLPSFWRLRIPVRQRLIVCFLFCIGFVACIISIIRLAFLHNLTGIDVTYNLATPLNWTVVECCLGIICVSIPPMRPLLSRLMPNFLPTHVSESRSGPAQGSRGPQRTREEALEEMNRELDRQLLEIAKRDDRSVEMAMSTLSKDGAAVEPWRVP